MLKQLHIPPLLKNMGALLVLVLGVNWFFTLQLVSLKDDNSFYYLPVRMYLSDALHNGSLPFWNPYIMNGIPQYADTQAAVWNPIALILCYFFKYNHTLFLVEYLLYIYIGALGMFKLLQLITQQFIYLIAGVTVYIACGYVSGIANFINWTAALAFIPWVFYLFFSLLKKASLLKAILLGVVGWLMLVCVYPAFIIYIVYILLMFFCWFVIRQIQHKQLPACWLTCQYILLALVIGLVLSLPAIIAYAEFLPFYSRGKALTTDLPFRDCFYPQFLASLFIPSSVYNTTNNVLCHSANRDIYFGVLPIIYIGIFLFKIKQYLNSFIKVTLGITIFTSVFLFGYLTPLGTFSYHYLPLLGSFKWSSLPRIFVIIVFIVAMVYELKQQNTVLQTSQIKTIRYFIAAMLVGVLVVFYISYFKYHFETNTHKNLFIGNAILQLVLWFIALIGIKKIMLKKQLLLLFILADLGINHTIGMAINGVANVKPAVFNKYVNTFYQQTASPYLKNKLGQNASVFTFNPWQNHHASKILNGSNSIVSNSIFEGYNKMFLQDTANGKILRNHAFVFSEDIDSITIHNVYIDYSNIVINITAPKAGNLIIQQNNYFRWQTVDGLPINTWKNCFMQLEVKQGFNKISLTYNKGNYTIMLLLQLLLCILLMGFVCWLFFKNNRIHCNKKLSCSSFTS